MGKLLWNFSSWGTGSRGKGRLHREHDIPSRKNLERRKRHWGETSRQKNANKAQGQEKQSVNETVGKLHSKPEVFPGLFTPAPRWISYSVYTATELQSWVSDPGRRMLAFHSLNCRKSLEPVQGGPVSEIMEPRQGLPSLSPSPPPFILSCKSNREHGEILKRLEWWS